MQSNKTALTLRSVLVGTIGLFVITASSMYVALKLGALPWPTVFVTILSMTALSKAKNSSIQEINCTHTLMSAGSMVAGGLAFTLPGLWIENPSAGMSLASIIVIALCGSALGLLFTTLYRKTLIEKQNLPYPIGKASYNTLTAAKEGKGSSLLFSSMGGSAIFTFLRDRLALIPSIAVLFSGSATVPALSLYISPMAVAIGSMIGPALSLVCVIGMVFGYYILTPVGIITGLFDSIATADIFRSNLGIGVMVGTGLGVAAKAIFSLIKSAEKGNSRKAVPAKKLVSFFAVLFLIGVVLVLFTEVSPLSAIIVLFGTAVVSYLSGMLTGQTGINPMEIFAILVLLACTAFERTSLVAAFSIAAVVAVACGLTGDVMNDLKSGAIVGTSPKDQITAEAIGAVVGSVIAAFVFFILKKTYTFGTEMFPAPQAKAVAAMATGLENPTAFYIGLAIGLLLFVLNIPSATLGLGIYLGTYISTAIGLGALLTLIAGKVFDQEKASKAVSLTSSGLLGGEGICGVIVAILVMLGI